MVVPFYFVCLYEHLWLHGLCRCCKGYGVMQPSHFINPLVMLNKSNFGKWNNPKFLTLFCLYRLYNLWLFVPSFTLCTYCISHGFYLTYPNPILPFILSLYTDHPQKDTARAITNNQWNNNGSKSMYNFVTSAFLFHWPTLWPLLLFLWHFSLMRHQRW